MNKRRWGDHVKHLGPFTWASKEYPKFGVIIDSGSAEHPGCHVRIYLYRSTLLIELPQIIRPWRQWIDTSGYDWSVGAKGYWDEHPREYGFSTFEGAIHLHYGQQTMDSSTDRVKVWRMPWREWRFVRYSLYGLDGEHFWTETAHHDVGASMAAKDDCPAVAFEFDDYDGELITATTRIEEYEWLFGDKWCKWLSLFRRPRVRRSLDIRFSSEVGRRKGSWKGGAVGHGIDMLPGELHEAAFRRYCSEREMTFVGLKALGVIDASSTEG